MTWITRKWGYSSSMKRKHYKRKRLPIYSFNFLNNFMRPLCSCLFANPTLLSYFREVHQWHDKLFYKFVLRRSCFAGSWCRSWSHRTRCRGSPLLGWLPSFLGPYLLRRRVRSLLISSRQRGRRTWSGSRPRGFWRRSYNPWMLWDGSGWCWSRLSRRGWCRWWLTCGWFRWTWNLNRCILNSSWVFRFHER